MLDILYSTRVTLELSGKYNETHYDKDKNNNSEQDSLFSNRAS